MAGLAGASGDEIEVGVVVEHGDVELLGGGGNQQVGNLASALMARCQQSLDLHRTPQVVGGGVDPHERVQAGNQAVPLGGAAGRVAADFQIADSDPGQPAGQGQRFDDGAHPGPAEAGEHARIDEMS